MELMNKSETPAYITEKHS